MNIDKLYRPIEFPVSLGTPMISPIINVGWDHKDDWVVPHYEETQDTRSSEQKYKIVVSSDDYQYLLGHKINGKFLGSHRKLNYRKVTPKKSFKLKVQL